MSPTAQIELNRLMDGDNSPALLRKPRTLVQLFDAAQAEGWTWFYSKRNEWRLDRTTGRWHPVRHSFTSKTWFAIRDLEDREAACDWADEYLDAEAAKVQAEWTTKGN